MSYIHFYTEVNTYGAQLALPRPLASAVYRLSNNSRYLTAEVALMVAQLPGAFWVK